MSEAKKSIVLKRLKSLDDTDRMQLLNKYTRQTENIYCTFGVERNIEIITKIFNFKFNKGALIDAYMKGDPLSMKRAEDSMISWIMNFKNNDSGAERMEAFQDNYKPLIQSRQIRLPIQTTLYELMETVIDVAGREDGKLVNEATIKILTKAKPRIRISQSLRY